MSSACNRELQEGWFVSPTPPPGQLECAEDSANLFATPGWAKVLEALGSEPVFAWHPAWKKGIVVPVFRRFGLRIGFLGLPVSGADFDSMDSDAIATCAIAIAKQAKLDWIRVNQSRQTELRGKWTAARPEAWIDDLQAWRATDKKLRKDLAYAHRSTQGISIADDGFDPGTCFDLYAATVARHGGRERYDAGYFAALGKLAMQSRLLDFVTAMEGEVVRGFAVLAIHGETAHYLHAAVDAKARQQGVTDLLLENLVDRARHAGCQRFTLMSSPWDQPGLLRFKQKWGDTTGLSVTRDFQRGLSGRCLSPVMRWRGSRDRRAASRFLLSSAS